MADDRDASLIEALIREPRASISALAASTGAADATVRKRLHALVAEGRAVPTVVLHPELLTGMLIFQLRITTEDAAAAERLVADDLLGPAPWVAIFAPGDVLLAQLSTDRFAEIALAASAAARLPGVRHVEVLVLTAIRLGEELPGAGALAASEPARVPDDTDWVLIRMLQADGRVSFTALAESVGLTTGAARRRVLRLVDDGIIRFQTRVTEGTPGDQHAANVDLALDASASDGVIDELSATPGIRYVQRQTGPFDAGCYVIADDEAGLDDALQQLRAHPAVRETRVGRVVAVRHRANWLF